MAIGTKRGIMSYSRWGSRGSGHWYTYWCVHPSGEKEDRDNAIFDICCVIQLSAKEIREDIQGCIDRVASNDDSASAEQLEELKVYMGEFLQDVDEEYPLVGKQRLQSVPPSTQQD